MQRKRPKGLLAMGWAAVEAAAKGRTEHAPTSADYPEDVVRRTSFMSGGGHGWRISALETPRAIPAPWKIVVITGAPSWAEYWAETLAELPQDREMIVVDRPGYAASEPLHPVTDIRVQAEALAPVLKPAPGQKVLLVGQSYGAAIASIMAEQNPGKVAGLVLLSGFFGEAGPTARWLLDLGGKALKMIPRDLRHAVIEVTGQKPQLRHAKRALARLNIPVHMIHGDKDDFAPVEVAERLAAETVTRRPIRVVRTEGANHFLNDGPAEILIAAIEGCIPEKSSGGWTFRWPKLPALWPLKLGKAAPVQLG
ncbi:MAG: alpha/beta hydrolase [Phenylobacterium sp.]|uniref:alpha/beta fold hydrolase n=1 Tax=Phenylobacterium sp. TaxID=1871053 RepID=UPI00121D41A8|nr:alpha/beta hydrolase [Phenylobacterium sp.]TAJ74537.1 MAG: alpha/beta hydrolase [Phenylobacterium sp.]